MRLAVAALSSPRLRSARRLRCPRPPSPGSGSARSASSPPRRRSRSWSARARTTFAVVGAARGDTVLRGALTAPKPWALSGEDDVRRADFSRLTRPGRYRLVVPGVRRRSCSRSARRGCARSRSRRSRASTSSARPFRSRRSTRASGRARRDTPTRRCSCTRPPRRATRPAGTRISSPLGWYDAGDYNKYVVNSGISTYSLLLLAEQYPQYASALRTNIPESGNALPDVLDEALLNVRWMLTMQDPADGGVYHKLTNAAFDGFVEPTGRHGAALRRAEEHRGHARLRGGDGAGLPRRAPVPAPAAGPRRLAAQRGARRVALGAPAPGLAVRAGPHQRAPPRRRSRPARTATGAWATSSAGPPPSSRSRRSRTASSSPRRRSASARSTCRRGPRSARSALVLARRASPRAVRAGGRVRDRRSADRSRALARAASPTRRPTASRWGGAPTSCGGATRSPRTRGSCSCRRTASLATRAYLRAAVANLDYLLGRNRDGLLVRDGRAARRRRCSRTTDRRAPTRSSHPCPGLLVGGPNPAQQDRCAGYPSSLPALSYVDAQCSYASNEIAINWNAPIAYLSAAIDAEYLARGTLTPASAKGRPYVVLVSLDAFRHDFLERYRPASLARLASRGIVARR